MLETEAKGPIDAENRSSLAILKNARSGKQQQKTLLSTESPDLCS